MHSCTPDTSSLFQPNALWILCFIFLNITGSGVHSSFYSADTEGSFRGQGSCDVKLVTCCECEECVDILYVFTSSRAFLARCLTSWRLMSTIVVLPHRYHYIVAFYIFIQQIDLLNILNTVYTLRFFSLQNAVCFIILTYLVPVLFTFYIQGVLKLKK